MLFLYYFGPYLKTQSSLGTSSLDSEHTVLVTGKHCSLSTILLTATTSVSQLVSKRGTQVSAVSVT